MMQARWLEHEGHVPVQAGLTRAHPQRRRPGLDSYDRILAVGTLGVIEDGSVSPKVSRSGFSSNLQITLTYEGLFAYLVGTRRLLVDSNQMLVTCAEEDWRERHPLEHVGHAAIVITPSKRLLDDITALSRPTQTKAGSSATALAPPSTRLLIQRLLAGKEPGVGEDEAIVRIVSEALCMKCRVADSPVHVERAKEFLHAFPGERFRLDEIAREVGVNAVYLTQLFSESEGLPLYQYQLQLRLNKALSALRSCEDITGLALDLGFSSHSHFSSTFRATFRVTPSQYRAEIKKKAAVADSDGSLTFH